MSRLDDDIARIAALRGRKASDYIDPETKNYRVAKRSGVISPDLLALIFTPSPNAKSDLAAYDRLPADVRRYIRNLPLPLNAQCYRTALDHMDEEALEILVQSHIPGQVARWLRRHWGDGHPSLRKHR